MSGKDQNGDKPSKESLDPVDSDGQNEDTHNSRKASGAIYGWNSQDSLEKDPHMSVERLAQSQILFNHHVASR
jgi:hypothetical protein